MESIIGPILVLALMDMVNPSAIAVTISLLLTSVGAHVRVLSDAPGMFSTHLVTGRVLMLGYVQPLLEGPAAVVIGGAIGTVLFAYSWIMPRTGQGEALVPAALIARGGTDTMVEMVTVVPYLGVIALMTRAGLPAAQWLPIRSSTRALRHATGRSDASLYDDRSVPEAVFRAARPVDHAQRARGVGLDTRSDQLPHAAGRRSVLRVLRPGRPAALRGSFRPALSRVRCRICARYGVDTRDPATWPSESFGLFYA